MLFVCNRGLIPELRNSGPPALSERPPALLVPEPRAGPRRHRLPRGRPSQEAWRHGLVHGKAPKFVSQRDYLDLSIHGISAQSGSCIQAAEQIPVDNVGSVFALDRLVPWRIVRARVLPHRPHRPDNTCRTAVRG